MGDEKPIFFDEAVELTAKQMKELQKITVPKMSHGLVQFASTKKGENKLHKSPPPKEERTE